MKNAKLYQQKEQQKAMVYASLARNNKLEMMITQCAALLLNLESDACNQNHKDPCLYFSTTCRLPLIHSTYSVRKQVHSASTDYRCNLKWSRSWFLQWCISPLKSCAHFVESGMFVSLLKKKKKNHPQNILSRLL